MLKDAPQFTLHLLLRRVYDYVVNTVKTPEKFFLTIAGLFGVMCVFLIPPMQAPDEQAHFYRAYQVSNLSLFAEKFTNEGQVHYGAQLPVSVYEASETFRIPVAGNPTQAFNASYYRQYLRQPLEPHKTRMVSNEAGNMYSPVIYIAQAVGITIGKVFNASPLIIIWLGRLANLALWLILIYMAIRLFPYAKWGLTLLALNPVSLTQSASLSGDVFTVGTAFLFVSAVMYLYSQRTKVSNKQLIMIAGLTGLMCLGKPVNILLSFLLLILPTRFFGSLGRRAIFVAAAVGISIILGLAWNLAVKDIINSAVSYQRPGGQVTPSAQIDYIAHHPLQYAKTIITNFVLVTDGSSADAVLRTYSGVFGWLDTSLPLWTQVVYVAALLLGVLYQFGRGKSVEIKWKIGALILFGVMFVGNVTAMYLNYTPVGARIFEGVQGRYFIPASILLLLIATSKKKFITDNETVMRVVLLLAMMIVLGMTLLKLATRYY
ncbi:DUF2142 domain-containing protein [Candidatus Saccharibacteria bacterium]|nr:DUF2142 domain-containing protein [Candidatus Saccharibacteria bacterium]